MTPDPLLPDFLRVEEPDPGAPLPRTYGTQKASITHGGEPKANSIDILGNAYIPPPAEGDFPPAPKASAPRAGAPSEKGDPKYGLQKNQNAQRISDPGAVPDFLRGVTTPLVTDEPEYQAQSPDIQNFLRMLVKTGRVNKAAAHCGLNSSSLYRLRKNDDDFASLWEQALGNRGEILEDEAMRRAVNGVDEPVFYMGAVVGYKRNYSDTLLMKMLEGAKPEKYRANHKIEVEGNLGVATLVLPAVTTEEQWLEQNNGTIIDQLPESDYD